MGRLSEHFRTEDFVCRCQDCRGKEYRIHLGLVGALELIGTNFKKQVNILSGFWCDSYNEKNNNGKKSAHTKGKAAHISIDGVPMSELFKWIEQNVPEINGLGFYPEANCIHVDTRKDAKSLWVKERGNVVLLTSEKRRQYSL